MYNPQELAIYIHWPFCKSKCPYCDFYKELARNTEQTPIIDEYLKALAVYRELLPTRTIKSVFFGGGTPSLIEPRHIERLLNFITANWKTSPQIEISLEANPNTGNAALFTDLKNAGINRLSLGVQALNDTDLRFLGRTHSLKDARQCLQQIVTIFSNHSADLIYARPQQTEQSWLAELEEICSYGLKHISLYQLTIEDGTVFARKNIQPLAEEKAAELYLTTREFLKNKGYALYEVSNFAKPGFASCHNLTYWQGGDYIGIGKSAHGRFFLNKKHIAAIYPFCHEELSADQRAEELIIMGLRLTQGINKKDFAQICGLSLNDFVNRQKLSLLKEQGLLEETPDSLYASPRGLLLLNYIIRELCC